MMIVIAVGMKSSRGCEPADAHGPDRCHIKLLRKHEFTIQHAESEVIPLL